MPRFRYVGELFMSADIEAEDQDEAEVKLDHLRSLIPVDFVTDEEGNELSLSGEGEGDWEETDEDEEDI